MSKADEASPVQELVSCPNCPNQGWYEIQGTTSECCNTPTATGECCGWPIRVPTLEQEQCQFCWLTPNSVFNASSS